MENRLAQLATLGCDCNMTDYSIEVSVCHPNVVVHVRVDERNDDVFEYEHEN